MCLACEGRLCVKVAQSVKTGAQCPELLTCESSRAHASDREQTVWPWPQRCPEPGIPEASP